ncbi:recombinase family protein [Dactylosporangium salmoneum]|uniref:Recombinase family protein n=1 Tax=Dactylosporangium salmoneum TaxID=53361 RepID=A0ABN3G8X8_9ACTN
MPRRRSSTPRSNAGRVILYVRVSALMGRGGDDFHSPDVQADGMRNLIARENLREVGVIDDDIDESGRSLDRPGIRRIRGMVEARQVDVVAVYTLSRVGRNLAESLEFIKWLRKHGVSIISATEKIDDTPEGQFMVGMWLNMAELQSNQIGQAWARVIERRARLGRPHGHAPQGYTRTDAGYIVDERLGPAVREMFTAYAAGAPVAQIVAAYGAARGTPIQRSTVKVMMRNPIYVGRIVLDSSTGGKIEVPGQHEPLVDELTWARVQRRMATDRQTPPRHLAAAYSLTSLGMCPHCKRNLQIWHSTEHGKDNQTRRIKCTRRNQIPDADCPGIGTPLYAPIEREVLRAVEEYAAKLRGDPGAREAQLARVVQAGRNVKGLERELNRTKDALIRLTEGWARGDVPDVAYEAARQRFADAEAKLAAQLEHAREVADAPPPAQVVQLVDEVLDLWGDMTEAERNRGLKTVLVKFTVRRGVWPREPIEDRVGGFVWRW